MNINFNSFIASLSISLDYIEEQVVGITSHHSLRVAYYTLLLAKKLNYNDNQLNDIVTCALMHDNALAEYIHQEYNTNHVKLVPNGLLLHCQKGEETISLLPLTNKKTQAILYHHENYDGSGPFHLKGDEIPMDAQIIHFADLVDIFVHAKERTKSNLELVNYLQSNSSTLFNPLLINLFNDCIANKEHEFAQSLNNPNQLVELIPARFEQLDKKEVKDIAEFFANIVDYKSPFTGIHSLGIAQKAETMGEYYHESEETISKLYLAGALHDIGKMAITNDILEKPARLTQDEYIEMKNHAWFTYQLLQPIQGLEDVAKWASNHHEKLNGQGYPFGKKANQLDRNSRLLACLDIYQALTESRPYKEGFSHDKAISILKEMADKEEVDSTIVEDINLVFKN